MTLSCKNQLLTPSRLLLPRELLQLSFLSFKSSVSPSLNTISHQRDALPISPMLKNHLPSKSPFLTSLPLLAHSSALPCHKMSWHGSVETAQQLTLAALSCRGSKFNSNTHMVVHNHLKLQFQEIQHFIQAPTGTGHTCGVQT